MRRILLIGSLLALVGMAGVLVYGVAAREADYRRLIAQGEAAAAQDQTFVAIEAFSGALVLKPDSMVAYLRRGEAYRRRGELGAAVRDFRTAVQLDPSATHPLEQLGDISFARGAYPAAVDDYRAFIRLDDRSPRVLYKLALAHRAGGQRAEAIDVLHRALAIDQRFAEAHYLLGLCLREAKQPAAVDELQKAIKLAPALVPAREELIEAYRGEGMQQEEIEQLTALGAIEPARAERQIALGLAYARAGRTDLAVGTLGAAAQRFSGQPRVYAALGRVWLDAAEARNDRSSLSKALEALNPLATSANADSESLTLFGRALLAANDSVGAEQVLHQATDRFPVDPVAFTLLATAAERNRHASVARDALVKYASLAGPRTEPNVLAQLGDLSLRVNDAAGAVAWYERARVLAPGDLQLESRLAEAQLRAGSIAAARETIARALARDPTNAAVLAVARRMK